jgi:transcriptional regulator with XRE-family HTH domain
LSKTQKSAAIGLLGKGLSQSETARKLGISRQIVNHWLKCSDFQREVEKARIDFLAAQEPQEPEGILLEKIPISISKPITTEPITTFKSTLRKREVDLLETIQSNLLPQLLEGGGVRVAAILLKVSERRSRLLGLDLPNWDILQAFETLVLEKCADPHQMALVSNGLDEITKQLKSSMDLNRVTGSE